ncbi:MAG: type I glyceraldehyde-3-phosphate dehydrogenase, partial [Deltaproteobacteria bacterium]|nr:type I glyceraldehyde-3-phosphate dehydrogenase [Deltaproteobacteria bacterium]
MARFAINGFGRIGRNILRAALERKTDFDVALINDIDKPSTLAHLFKYDSVHGRFEGEVTATDNAIVINGKKIAVTAIKEPAALPHREHHVDI